MTNPIDAVVEHFSRILAADGGSLTFLGRDGSTVRLRYDPGVNEDCADCVLSPEDLHELLFEAAARQDPTVGAIELVTDPAPPAGVSP